jgi:L-arabinose isomerase
MEFKNQEVWFVTGAQLLYGGDAVITVNAHSEEIVKGLNEAGTLPIKVVYKGTANSSRSRKSVQGSQQRTRMCGHHHLDAHFLSGEDVDQRIAELQ